MQNSDSITMVSGSQPQIPTLSLSVVITIPDETPYTGRVATVSFNWQDSERNPAPVQGFGLTGLLYDTGVAELFDFAGTGSSYTVKVRFTQNEGNLTITVPKNSAALVADTNIIGPSEDTSVTIVYEVLQPIVKISVPTERPITVRPVPLVFEWVYPDGTPWPVENFDETDIETSVGVIRNFAQVSGDASRYTAELVIPKHRHEHNSYDYHPSRLRRSANVKPTDLRT